MTNEQIINASVSTLKRKLKTATKDDEKKIKAELSARGVYLKKNCK